MANRSRQQSPPAVEMESCFYNIFGASVHDYWRKGNGNLVLARVLHDVARNSATIWTLFCHSSLMKFHSPRRGCKHQMVTHQSRPCYCLDTVRSMWASICVMSIHVCACVCSLLAICALCWFTVLGASAHKQGHVFICCTHWRTDSRLF